MDMCEIGKGKEDDVTSYLMLIPIEIRCMIAKMLNEFRDINNLCILFPHLYEHMGTRLKVLNTKDMIRTISMFPETDMKSLRLVSKSWKAGVDQCMDPSQVNYSISSKKSKKHLITTIQLPLSKSDGDWMLRLSQRDGSWIIGHGLRLELRDVYEAIDSPDMINDLCGTEEVFCAMATNLKGIRHLEIAGGYFPEPFENVESAFETYDIHFNGGVQAVFGPILQYLTNVVRIKLSHKGCAKATTFLPTVNQIEEILVNCDSDYVHDEWIKLVKLCRPRLKLLHGSYELQKEMEFPALSEIYPLKSQALCTNQFMIDAVAPNLTSLKLTCSSDGWVNLAELTHRLRSLRYIEIKVMGLNKYRSMLIPSGPQTFAQQASDRLEKVLIHTNDHDNARWQSRMLPYLFHPTTKIVFSPPYNGDIDDELLEPNKDVTLPINSCKHAMRHNVGELLMRPFNINKAERALLRDLLDIAICVNGPVMVSKELWIYLGGSFRISYESFKRLAGMTLYSDENSLTVSLAMEYIFRRFGPRFYRGIDYFKVRLSDNDWVEALSSMADLSINEWKRVHAAGFGNSLSLEDLWEQFYSALVPRIQDKNIFGHLVPHLAWLQLSYKSREVMISLYHSVRVWSMDGFFQAIHHLIVAGVIDLDNVSPGPFSLLDIFDEFHRRVVSNSCEYFVTTRVNFELVTEWVAKLDLHAKLARKGIERQNV